ncbi:MAG: hypothetical protein KDI63_13770 [Gammaproteobacteria bacterium]|nr:hypothetical protein [Gammaproteobacteria bacterium]
MKGKLLAVLSIAIVTLALTGCPHQADVYNVENASIVANIANVSAADVRKAIIRAGGTLGWNIKDAGPDRLEGTLHLRSHVAKVDIPYSPTSYSILYNDSTNLRYDGTKIHSNYNGWIQNLHKAIQVQLNTL